MLNLRRYLGALAVAMAAYGSYALLAAPWLEPPALGRGESSGFTMPGAQTDDSFRALFEPGSWELDNPKVVETAQCTLLLKDYQPLPDGRMEINPCTLIFYAAVSPPSGKGEQGGSFSARRPIVLRAPEGAVLQFDRPIDVGRAAVGRLMEGTLRGKIRIFSPPSRPGVNDALELTTRNVKIDREKVYTPSTVDFRYGSSFGSGRDLTITLLPDDQGSATSAPSVGGLSVLQLARVDRLHLEGNSSGLLPEPSNPSQSGPRAAGLQENLPLEVRCDGPLVVDFEQNLVALDENVEISRVYPQGPPDRLTCDRLIFHLIPKGTGPKSSAAKLDSRRITEQVERAIAVGSPVILDAPQAGTYARAARVEYFAATQRIALEGGPGAPQVTLKHQQSEFEARGMEYEMAEPGRLGRLWAAGPGRLKFVPAPGQQGQPATATWQGELRIAPHEQSKLVSLKGNPVVTFGDNSTFSTTEREAQGRSIPGEIYLWLLEVPEGKGSPANAAARSSPTRYAILPDRMLATGRVEVDSPQLAAHTLELQAWFEHPATPAASGTPGAVFEPAPTIATSPQRKDPAGLQKLDLTGNLVQLKVIRRGSQTEVEDLAITGSVQVRELPSGDAASAGPLELVGEAVVLRQWTGQSAKLEVQGTPPRQGQKGSLARISARGLSLSGGTIHLRRADNRLWIPGPGEAVLPIPVDMQERPLSPPGAVRPSQAESGRPSATRPLKVTWQDAFEFDGQKGVFSGQIEARGQAEFAAGQELSITLNQRIDFTAPQQHGPLELAQLEFGGGQGDVTMQRVLYDEAGKPSAVDNARVRILTIDRTTGKLHATGPGEVWTVRQDLQTVAGNGSTEPRRAEDKKLAYVCVTFQGQIVGDLNRSEITFQQQVDTIYGEVSDWSQRVAATRAEDLGNSGVHLLSDSLKVTEMSLAPDRKWVELDASGNAQAEGFKFFAQAARISYTSDKDQLVLEAGPYAPAEFWNRTRPGGDFSQVRARRFIFQRSTGNLQIDDGQSIDLSDLPLGGKPPPKLR